MHTVEMVLQPALYGPHPSYRPLNFSFFGLHLASPLYEQWAREMVFAPFGKHRRKNLCGLAANQKKCKKE